MPCNSSFSSGVKIAFLCLSASSGMLSTLGSSCIVSIICRGGRTKISRVHNRLILAASIIDIFSSIAFGLSFVPAPNNPSCPLSGYGNMSSCTAQGFFLQLGQCVPAYTAMMALFAMMTIAKNTREDVISGKYEIFMHLIAIGPILTLACIGASKKLYFGESSYCWINDINLLLGVDDKSNTGWSVFGKSGFWVVTITMIHGFLTFIIISYCLFKLIHELRKRASIRRRITLRSNKNCAIDTAAIEATKQALLYIGGFFLTYIWTLISLVFSSDKVRNSPVLFLLTSTFLPLQGFWNFIAYVRPRILKIQEEHPPDFSYISALKALILSSNNDHSPHSPPRQINRSRKSEMRNRLSFIYLSPDMNELNLNELIVDETPETNVGEESESDGIEQHSPLFHNSADCNDSETSSIDLARNKCGSIVE